MKIKVCNIVDKCGMDYTTIVNLYTEGKTEISFEEAMSLRGRGILVDKEQDIYTNDLAQEERKSSLSTIFEYIGKQV